MCWLVSETDFQLSHRDDMRFPTRSGEPSALSVYFLKCPKWCRSTKVDLDLQIEETFGVLR